MVVPRRRAVSSSLSIMVGFWYDIILVAGFIIVGFCVCLCECNNGVCAVLGCDDRHVCIPGCWGSIAFLRKYSFNWCFKLIAN